jgi:hypothetical protein
MFMLTAKRRFTLALICLVLGATAPHVVASVPASKHVPLQIIEQRVHLNPPAENDSRYAYIPFSVPSRAKRINISYQYDRAAGANTIDIGLFDTRSSGLDTDPRGFRGWSGGSRAEFFISRNEATPGYLSGEMPAGTWRIILGLYKVAAAGVDVSFKIGIQGEENVSQNPAPRQIDRPTINASTAAVSVARNAVQRPSSPQEVAGQAMRWWRGDLHMHTVHSDGTWTIAELINYARNTGLNFIFITDHNTASHHAEIDRLRGSNSLQPLVLRGEEITTYGGHTNAWGLPSGTWIDFRAHAKDTARISSIAAETHRAGALISINHPFALCGGCSWSYDASARGFDGIEVWNGAWDATDEQALTMWDKILQSGRHITAIASSDSHRSDTPIGQPTTHVAANALSEQSLLKGIRQGRVYLTGEVARPRISFEAEEVTKRAGGQASTRRARAMIGDEMQLNAPGILRFLITTEATSPDAIVSLISNGQVIRSFPATSKSEAREIEIEVQRNSYFRIEVRDKTKAMLALTNPIYLKIRAVQ